MYFYCVYVFAGRSSSSIPFVVSALPWGARAKLSFTLWITPISSCIWYCVCILYLFLYTPYSCFMSCRVIILHPKVHVCNFPPHFEYFPLFLHFVLVIVFIMCLYFVYLLVVCIFCISYLLPYFVFVLVFSFIERYAYPFYISLHFMCIFYILQICNTEPCDACAQLPFDVRIPLNHYFVFVFVSCIFLFYFFQTCVP